MDSFAEWFKDWLIPGSVTFLMVAITPGILLLFCRERVARWGRRWLTGLTILYWILSTPLAASGLERLLAGDLQPLSPQTIPEGVRAVVILGGGGGTYESEAGRIEVLSEASSLRVLEGARLLEMLDRPWVIVSGGVNPEVGLTVPESETMRATLISLGVPEERILVEAGSANTHDQAIRLKPMLQEAGAAPFLLVTSPSHMRRAYLTFVQEDLQPIPAPSSERTATREPFGFAILPQPEALEASRNVMREIFGLLYYALRGWI